MLAANADGSLTLAASNLEWSIVHTMSAQVEAEGQATIPVQFGEWVKSLPTGTLTLESTEKHAVKGNAEGAKARFSGVDPEQFPALPDLGGDSCVINAGALRAALNKTVFAAGNDLAHPALTAVYVEIQGESLTLAAADGFRLSQVQVALATPAVSDLNFLVPAETLRELGRLTWDDEATVTISVNDLRTQVGFDLGDTQVVSRLMDGKFPDYRQIIPTGSPITVTLNRGQLLGAVKRAAIFARESINAIRMELLSNAVRISGASAETGEGTTEVEAEIAGGELEIAFNARYLTDLLGALTDDAVRMQFSIPTRPGVFDAGAPGFVHVVMPMHIQPPVVKGGK
jgi:DNA polymerase-3 subunit beta